MHSRSTRNAVVLSAGLTALSLSTAGVLAQTAPSIAPIIQIQNAAWQQLPGAGRDIAIAKSSDATVYVISTRQATGGFACDRWDPAKNNWAAEASCAGIGIGAGPGGIVYVARGTGQDALTRNAFLK